MAELQIDQDERPGILKEIDEGAKDLIFQAMQEDIYSFPIRSFIRETISNCIDSNREKELAKDILVNGAPESKYFLQRDDDGKLLKDSAFDRDYYDPEYLSDDNVVEVEYKDGSTGGRDTFIINDYGVGLGGSRLRGYFRLGYSSKRNLKNLIGKFGVGAKSGLATGVDSYMMTTRYNGYETSFMIFKHDYEAVTPQEPNGRTEVWKVHLSDGSESTREVYWKPTTQKNGVTLTIEAKKHNKDKYIEAVTKQFSAFTKTIKLKRSRWGISYNEFIDKPVLFQNEYVIIQQESEYSRPYIIVDGINYGLISWNELELEARYGRVGIKVKATDVDINQSRETLKWTDKTKTTILEAVKRTKESAEIFLQGHADTSGDSEDFFSLASRYKNKVSNKNTSGSPLMEFEKFLSNTNLKAEVEIQLGTEKAKITFNSIDSYLITGPKIEIVTYVQNSRTSYVNKVGAQKFEELANLPVVIGSNTPLTKRKVRYIHEKYGVKTFIYARKNRFVVLDREDDKLLPHWWEYFKQTARFNIDSEEFTGLSEEAEEEEAEITDNDVYNDAEEAARLRKQNEVIYVKAYLGMQVNTTHWRPTGVDRYLYGLTDGKPTVSRIECKPSEYVEKYANASAYDNNLKTMSSKHVMFNARHEPISAVLRGIRSRFMRGRLTELKGLFVASSNDYDSILDAGIEDIEEFKSYLFRVEDNHLEVCPELRVLYGFYKIFGYLTGLNFSTKLQTLNTLKTLTPSTSQYYGGFVMPEDVSLFTSEMPKTITDFVSYMFKDYTGKRMEALKMLALWTERLVVIQELLENPETKQKGQEYLKDEFKVEGIETLNAFDSEPVNEIRDHARHINLNREGLETLFMGATTRRGRLSPDQVSNINQLIYLTKEDNVN